MPTPGTVVMADGSLDWSGGVDSVKVATIQSQANPNGLARNQLAWLDNATVRDGGITPRGGYSLVGAVHGAVGLFQGKWMYDPFNADPYEIWAISGQIYKVTITPTFTVTNLTAQFPGTGMPATQDQFFFCQAEQFLVIQAGDNVTLPLFWDGALLRRSKGITNQSVAPGTPGINEIPAATAMDYFMGRLWYATGRVGNAGDIVKGPSGTAPYQFNDAVLNVTENPLVVGGDGFSVPAQAGNIRAIFHNANLNTQLGQGTLFFGTRRAVFSLNVPVSRSDWVAAGNNNQPLMTVVQLINGPVNDRTVVQVNGDVYYEALEPSVRSLLAAIRYFNQPGNIEISAQEQRVLNFIDRSLMRFSFGVEFGSRLFMGAQLKQLPQGVVAQSLMPLDFIPMSSYGSNQAPIWEGMNEGLQMLQAATGDFGGRQRAFAAVVSGIDGTMELWEMSEFNQFDTNRFQDDARIQWYAEFPSFTWGDEFMFKELVSGELWVDRVYGTVIFQMDYRPDGETCWIPWHQWQICSSKSTCEDVNNPICYPILPHGEGYRSTMTLPKPPTKCEVANNRPSNLGYQFQPRLTVLGFCRVRGLILYAEQKDRKLYQNLVCGDMFQCPPDVGPLALPRPVEPKPAPTPVPVGYAIQNFSGLAATITGGGTCAASTEPAWNGVFNLTAQATPGPIWYFINQSFKGFKVAANNDPLYPNGDFANLGVFMQIYYFGGGWNLWLVCNSGDLLWLGSFTTSDTTNPSGIYVRSAGDSALPATITIAHV